MIKSRLPLLLLLGSAMLHAQTSDRDEAVTNPLVHDPVMIRQGDTYYVFATGRGVAVWSSRDRFHWTQEKPVFATPPAWATEAVPTFRGYIWAPDISQYAGKYYLYYSVSAFGKNTSCIGVATNSTLDPADPDFKWVDHGKVIQSIPGVTDWNAIDPNIVAADDGTPFMSFGSFWGGLKLVKLTADRLGIAESPADLPTIASRKRDPQALNSSATPGNSGGAGSNAIEAPFIFKHGTRYYLFASIDYCCRGAKSDYKMIVGCANVIAGPYFDRAGVPLASGGGTILLTGDAQWYGVGHNAVCTFDSVDYLIFHAYDASDERGRARLRIERLKWDDAGWPTVEVTKP